MYYILYTTFENVKYLKTCSGLQDQRSAGADYSLIDSVLLLYSSLVFNLEKIFFPRTITKLGLFKQLHAHMRITFQLLDIWK